MRKAVKKVLGLLGESESVQSSYGSIFIKSAYVRPGPPVATGAERRQSWTFSTVAATAAIVDDDHQEPGDLFHIKKVEKWTVVLIFPLDAILAT